MKVIALPRATRPRVRWKNGAGWTTEIAAGPAGTDAFDWRVSVAEIDADSEFSRFPGIDRTLTVLEGAGIELHVDGSEPVLLNERGRPHAFPGDAAARCRVLAGPTRDFNVMTRRGVVAQRVLFRPLVGPMVLFPELGVRWLVYVAAGRAARQHVADSPWFETGDAMLLEPDESDTRQIVFSGSGEVALVRLQTL